MTFRNLACEIRSYPATFAICGSWVAIFAAMTYCEYSDHDRFLTPMRWLVLGFPGGARFGDLTLRELGQGQIWRLITCNFIHFSLIHLGLNIIAMYQLGSMIEEWYGSYCLVFLYAFIGGGGNLLSAGIRHGLGSSPEVHSGGGSVLIMGLVGMCAVVGLRVGNRWGKSLSRTMIFFLVITALMGILLPRFIDNWGHAGGAIVGAPMGLADRWLVANRSKPSVWGLGMVAGLIMACCGAAQYVMDERQAPARLEKTLISRSDNLAKVALDLGLLVQMVERGEDLAEVGSRIEILEQIVGEPARRELQGVKPLVESEDGRPLAPKVRRQLEEGLRMAGRLVRQEYVAIQRQIRELSKGGRPGR